MASVKHWNEIDCNPKAIRNLEVSPNEYGEQPICITIEARSRNEEDMMAWILPEEARALAEHLNKLADAVDAAGKV